MDLAHLAKDVLLLSKARSEVVAEQMARRVPHEVRVVTMLRRNDVGFVLPVGYGESRSHVWHVTDAHLWNPITERLEPYDSYHLRGTGVRNALVARGYVEVQGEDGQRDGYGRFEVLVPVRELQRIYMRPAKRVRLNPSDTES